jgi:hypothetical protein
VKGVNAVAASGTYKKHLQRLLNLRNQPQHQYAPATEVFLDLDDLNLASLGKERGEQNRPTNEAVPFDDIESTVLERIEAHQRGSFALLSDHLQTYDARLAALNFEERFSVIRQTAPETLSDFGAEATIGRNELFGLRRKLYDTERERDHFRERHKLTRPARVSTSGRTILKIGILLVLLMIEVTVNGSYLSVASEGGLLGGAVEAFGFAALNIFASFLWGLILIRLVNRREWTLKAVGLVSAVAYVAFVVGLNLTLAHLREIEPTIGAQPSQQVIAILTTEPFQFKDVNSLILLGIGLLFSLVAMVDGVQFTDPYFGYASLEKRCTAAQLAYTERMAELIDDLVEIRDTASQAMSEASRDLGVRRGEYSAILQARLHLLSRFRQHQNQIQRSANTLLSIYREANIQARTVGGSAPAYFSEPFKLDRIESHADSESVNVQGLDSSIEGAKSLLAETIGRISKAFDEAMATYREMDVLIPENGFASPSK